MILIMWTSVQPLEMWPSLSSFHQRAYLKPPLKATMTNNAASEREQDKGGKENSEERQLLPLSVSAGRNMTREKIGAQKCRICGQWRQLTCSWEHTCSYHRRHCRRHWHSHKFHCCWGLGIWWCLLVYNIWRWGFSPAKFKTTYSSYITRMFILDFSLLFYPCDYIKLFSPPKKINTLPMGIWTSLSS